MPRRKVARWTRTPEGSYRAGGVPLSLEHNPADLWWYALALTPSGEYDRELGAVCWAKSLPVLKRRAEEYLRRREEGKAGGDSRG